MIATGTPTQQICLVEDDHELSSLISEYLSKQGYQIHPIYDGLSAARQIPQQQPDLVVLDIMLPGLSGMDVCRQVRPHYTGPILMLTALDDDMDQLLGLELGADDYVIKPVAPRLLLARIHALLRRTEPANQTSISSEQPTPSASPHFIAINGLEIALQKRAVTLHGEAIDLTTSEYELLLLLAESAGHIVDRDQMMTHLRGLDYDGMDRSVDRRISRLRKKLQDDPHHPTRIKTVRGKGYLLCLDN